MASTNSEIPDFGNLMDEECPVVDIPDDMMTDDALIFPSKPQHKFKSLPLFSGAVPHKADKDAKEVSALFLFLIDPRHLTDVFCQIINKTTAAINRRTNPTIKSTNTAIKIIRKDPKKTVNFWKLPMTDEPEVSYYSHLDYLFDFECKDEAACSLTYDFETGKAYEIFHDPRDLSNRDKIPIRETLQTPPVFQRIDARVSPEPEEAVATDPERVKGKKKERKGKGKRKSKIIVDADVEMLESWTAEIDDKVPGDYGKMKKEQRKRFEKMGIRR